MRKYIISKCLEKGEKSLTCAQQEVKILHISFTSQKENTKNIIDKAVHLYRNLHFFVSFVSTCQKVKKNKGFITIKYTKYGLCLKDPAEKNVLKPFLGSTHILGSCPNHNSNGNETWPFPLIFGTRVGVSTPSKKTKGRVCHCRKSKVFFHSPLCFRRWDLFSKGNNRVKTCLHFLFVYFDGNIFLEKPHTLFSLLPGRNSAYVLSVWQNILQLLQIFFIPIFAS